jgi:hypothetical protein
MAPQDQSHIDHKRIEVLVRLILGLVSTAIIAAFWFAFDTNSRLATLEATTSVTVESHKRYDRGIDKRITRLETIIETLQPRVERIDANLDYLVGRYREDHVNNNH